MVKPICAVASETGIRYTSSDDVYNMMVEAYATLALGDIDRVEFAVSVNGGGATTTTVTARNLWTPTDTSYDDPLPGNFSGPAPMWCYGMSLTMRDYAQGYIDIVPTVYTSDESTTLRTVRIYNDKGGADSRPSTKEIYFDNINGDDANPGTSTGNAVATFQKALELVATSGDCGGGTIIIDSEGVHEIDRIFGSNTAIFTGGHWWLQVKPRTGLTGSNVIIKDGSNLDLSFEGTSASQEFRLRLSDLVTELPGINLYTGTNIGHFEIWQEHTTTQAPAPFDQDYGGFTHIRAHESSGSSALFVVTAGTFDIRYTGHTRKNCWVGGNHYNTMMRGVHFKNQVGVVLQPNQADVAYCNVYIENLYQNYGVSGYFPYDTAFGQLETRPLGGNIYRLQSLDPYYTDPYYNFTDIANTAAMLTGSSYLNNIMLSNFPTIPANTNYEIVGHGYSGSLPYIDISGATLTAEYAVAGQIQNGNTNSPGNIYNVWGAHSDIIQFWNGPCTNIIMSNMAVFPAWEGQGLFSSTQDISGFACVNYYDGPPSIANIGEVPRSYFPGSSNYYKNFVVRNAFLSRLQVNSSASNENHEWIDCSFGSWTDSVGMDTYLSDPTINIEQAHVIRYQGFAKEGPVGTNPSSGEAYFADSGAFITGTNATVATYSDAYGTAGTSWDRPSQWDRGDRGPMLNVALADWTTSTALGTTTGDVDPPLMSLSQLNTGVYQISTDVTSALSGISAMAPNMTFTVDSSSAPLTGETEIEVDPSDLYSRSAIVLLESEGVKTITVNASDSTAVVTNTTSVTVGTNAFEFTVTVGDVTTFTTNVIAEPPRRPPTVTPVFSINAPTSTLNIEQQNNIRDDEILPVLSELNRIDNNIANASTTSKEVWSQNILENVDSPAVHRTVIKINTANYNKFSTKSKDPAGKVLINRRRF